MALDNYTNNYTNISELKNQIAVVALFHELSTWKRALAQEPRSLDTTQNSLPSWHVQLRTVLAEPSVWHVSNTNKEAEGAGYPSSQKHSLGRDGNYTLGAE